MADSEKVIVQAVLEEFLDARAAANAAETWHRFKMGSRGTYSVVNFIEHIAPQHDLDDAEQRHLRLQLFRRLTADTPPQKGRYKRLPAQRPRSSVASGSPLKRSPRPRLLPRTMHTYVSQSPL